MNKEKNLSAKELVDAAYCAGLIQGITDTHRINQTAGGSPLFCLPGDVIDKSQVTRIVVNYLRSHLRILSCTDPLGQRIIDELSMP